MPFVTFYLSKGDEKVQYDVLIDYPHGVMNHIRDGYHLDEIVPDSNKKAKGLV